MKNCPPHSEIVAHDITESHNQGLIELYRENKKLCAIIALGQGKSDGMAILGKTKNYDFPNGLVWEFIDKAKKANMPSVAKAMIEMDVELDWLQVKGTRDFYNDMVGVMDKYEVEKTNC